MDSLDLAFLLILIVTCTLIIVWSAKDKRRMYQYPFLVSLIFALMIIPQLIGLIRNSILPDGAAAKTALMCVLCLLACFYGYKHGATANIRKLNYNPDKLLICSFLTTLIGAYFYYSISRLAATEVVTTMWTGKAVAYNFFAQLLPIGFSLSLLHYLKYKKKIAIAIFSIGLLFYFDRIVIGGRRSVSIEFVLVVMSLLWFQKKILIPKGLFILLAVVGTMMFLVIAEYRNLDLGNEGLRSILGGARLPSVSELSEFGYKKSMKTIFTKGGAELEAASYLISAADTTHKFDYGLFHWNALVHQWVPAQIVGRDFKESLMVSFENDTFKLYGFEKQASTAFTGIADGFVSFWYFGCIKFYLIAYFLKIFFIKAEQGDLKSQMLYVCLLLSALHAVPHHTNLFAGKFIYLLLFVYPIFIYSKESDNSHVKGGLV